MNVAAIEGGGTKFVVAIITDNAKILERYVIDTTTPKETMGKVVSYLKDKDFDAIGLGTFGPIDLNKDSETYGYITTTPKKLWTNFDIVSYLKQYFNVPIAFDTDVNAAALGELNYGNASSYDSCLYLTVGTGIGGGIVCNNFTVKGMLHPELGHVKVSRYKDDNVESTCIYHDDCLEGFACGPAIEKRVSKKAYELDIDDPVWDLEAYYLGQAISNFILTTSPQKIILGGGVMKQEQLFDKIKHNVMINLNGYIQSDLLDDKNYITSPGLGDNAGIVGCYVLGQKLMSN